MSAKIGSLANPLHSGGAQVTSDNLPNEIMLSIIQLLGIKDCLSASLTCHRWKAIVDDPTTIYSKNKLEIAVTQLSLIAPKYSAWEAMPTHWGLYTTENVLKFSSCSSDILTFHPPFCCQSSKFFSFDSSISLSDRYIFLAKYGSTYFLTEQSQTRLQLELPTDLQPLASYKLIMKNFQDSSKNKEVSLLRNLAATSDNLSMCQIEDCFPISENQIAVLTNGGEVSLWDFTKETPICYRTFQIEIGSQAYRIDNFLVLNNKIIDLITQEVIEHEFTFQNEIVNTCDSALCSWDKNNKEIRYFTINNAGLLHQPWSLNPDSLLEHLDRTNGQMESSYIKDMNGQYVILVCWQRKALNLLILNSNGELIHSICQKLIDEELEHFELYKYPHFAHVSGNILTYKHPQNHTLYFWHIPTKKLIKEFEWTNLIYDVPLYFDSGFVQDVRLHDNKLTILLSSQHKPGSNKPVKFRIIQFDPQSMPHRGYLDNIYSTLHSIYYAFPGKLSY